MKTGDKYFRYGQTGIRPEDFTGPCPQCVTECNDEVRRMFQKFNFWSVDSGAIGEKVHYQATPSLDFSVGGGYELGEVVRVKSNITNLLGDIRIQFEDEGDPNLRSRILGCGASDSSEGDGFNEAKEFAKYDLSVVYQHLFGEFTNPPTESEIECYCTWARTHHKRVAKKQDVTLTGCEDCIHSDEHTEMEVVLTDEIDGTIYQNMVNTATTVEEISIYAPIDIFSFQTVCGDFVIEESPTFEFDYLEEVQDSGSSGDDGSGDTGGDDDSEETGNGDGQEDVGSGEANLGGDGDGADAGGDPDSPDDGGDGTGDDTEDDPDDGSDDEEEKSYNRYKGQGFFLFARGKCESIDGSQELEISGTSKHPHIIGSHPTRRASSDQNSQGRYFHNTQHKKTLAVERQTKFAKIGVIYHTTIHEADWGEAMVNQPGDGGAEYWTTVNPFIGSRSPNVLRPSYPDCADNNEEGSELSPRGCCKYCKEELAENEDNEEPNENANGVACGVLEFPKLPEEHYYTLIPCTENVGGFGKVKEVCKKLVSFDTPFVKRASDFCEEQKKLHFESEDAAVESLLENYKEKEIRSQGNVAVSAAHQAGTSSMACGFGNLMPFSRNEIMDPETGEPTGEYGDWSRAYVHGFPEDAIDANCSEMNRVVGAGHSFFGGAIAGVCRPGISGYIAMTDLDGDLHNDSPGESDTEGQRIYLHAKNDLDNDRSDFDVVGHRIKGGDGDVFELTKLDYLINDDIEIPTLITDDDGSESFQLVHGGNCATYDPCGWFGQSSSELRSNKGITQLIGVTFYKADIDSLQTQTGTVNIGLEQVYQKVFDRSIGQIPEDVGNGGFDNAGDIQQLVKDWYDVNTRDAQLSIAEYIYKANKPDTYLYNNDPFLVAGENTYYDFETQVQAGFGFDNAISSLSGYDRCGTIAQINGWTGEEELTGCYDTRDRSGFGACGTHSYVTRKYEDDCTDFALCAPYSLRVEDSCQPMRKAETCNEGSLEFFVGHTYTGSDNPFLPESFALAPPAFDEGQRIFDCDIIVDEIFMFPTVGNAVILGRGEDFVTPLDPENNIIKRCIFDEDGNIKEGVPEDMICVKEGPEGEEIKEICRKDGYIYIIHRENVQHIFPAPMKPPIELGGNQEDLGKIGANGKRCWEQFPEPEDKYVYACGTKMYFTHKFDEDAFDEAGNLKDNVSDPDQYIPIDTGNFCTLKYPLQELRTVDEFDLSIYHCSKCNPNYEAECVYKKDADGNDTNEVAACKMKCAGSEQFEIATPWVQQFGGPDMPGTCCDVCMDTDEPPDNQLDTCFVTYYVCGEESSPYDDGYVWWRGREGDKCNVETCFDEFATGRGRMIDECCALNVKCNIIPVNVGEIPQVEIDANIKSISEIPLDIKLH